MENNRIDVLLASPLFYPVYTGVGTRFQHYAPGLQTRGIDLRVLTGTRFSQSDNPEIPLVNHQGNLPVSRILLSGKSSFHRDLQYARALLTYCHAKETRPMIIHLLSSSLYWILFSADFRKLRIPIILSHTLLGEMSTNVLKKRLQRFYWKLPFSLADCIVTQSITGYNSLRELGIKTRIEIIPNGVDLIRFRPVASLKEKRALRSRLGLPLDAEIVVYAGSLTKRKGVDLLLEAWSKIERKRLTAYLVLVGPKAREMRQESRDKTEQEQMDSILSSATLGKNILLPGWVGNVEDYYRAADVFVLPSIREGMPNVLLEAYACGLTCILTPFLGLSKELGNDGEQYLLVERDANVLAATIERLLDEEPLRRQLGISARRWAERTLGIETSLDQYAKLYFDLYTNNQTKIAQE